jgi:hypothetical protein
MAVALASPSALAKNQDARARFVQRHQEAVLRAAAPRMAKDLQRTFEKLRDSFITGDEVQAKANLPLKYSTPDYDAFENALHKIMLKEYVNVGEMSLAGVRTQLGLALEFDLNERIIDRNVVGHRVKGIVEETRQALSHTIENGIDDGLHPSVIARNLRDQLNGWAGLEDLTRSRAYTIARTETANAYNLGAV